MVEECDYFGECVACLPRLGVPALEVQHRSLPLRADVWHDKSSPRSIFIEHVFQAHGLCCKLDMIRRMGFRGVLVCILWGRRSMLVEEGAPCRRNPSSMLLIVAGEIPSGG